MSDKSAIEWTDATWNPVTGCTKVSPACANCYIERTPPFRVRGRKFVRGHIPLEFHDERLMHPVKRKKPTVYFVNSLSDLFHDDVSDEFISRTFGAMAASPQHTFQVLTKRADRMRNYLDEMSSDPDAYCFAWAREEFGEAAETWPLPNVWLGVSVENQHFADGRIPFLMDTPAAVRFLSMEPLLGPVTIPLRRCERCQACVPDGLCCRACGQQGMHDRQLDWVIVGAESGPNVRPTDPAWVRSIRDQCVPLGIPFFFKQWGGRTSKSGGRALDGRTWDEMPPLTGALRTPSFDAVREDCG